MFFYLTQKGKITLSIPIFQPLCLAFKVYCTSFNLVCVSHVTDEETKACQLETCPRSQHTASKRQSKCLPQPPVWQVPYLWQQAMLPPSGQNESQLMNWNTKLLCNCQGGYSPTAVFKNFKNVICFCKNWVVIIFILNSDE